MVVRLIGRKRLVGFLQVLIFCNSHFVSFVGFQEFKVDFDICAFCLFMELFAYIDGRGRISGLLR